MALQGTLDTVGLPDVLRLLAATGKTGRLGVEGDRGRGSLWTRDGTVMAASSDQAVDDAAADEVLFELLRYETGSFVFDLDEQSPPDEEPTDVETLLRNAMSLLDEWHELQAVVPSLKHRVRLVAALPEGEVTIDSRRWPHLAAVGPGQRVDQLATTLRLGELDVSRVVRDLVDLGVAEVEAPDTGRPHPPASGASVRGHQ